MPTIINIDTFITPKKSQHQQLGVRQTVTKFILDPIVVDLQSKAYNPFEEISLNDENKTRLLFHGTRKSYLSEFEYNGVAGKVQWRPNELCPDRAFYATTSVEQAVADVLYGCPQPTHMDIVDPIVILVFAVDVTVLHGDRPLPNKAITFSTYWYEHDDLEHCQEFIEYAKQNLQLTRPSYDLNPFDYIRIAPICLPTDPHPIILPNWTQQDIYLTQVAACKRDSQDFFSNSLVQILEEKSIEKVAAAL